MNKFTSLPISRLPSGPTTTLAFLLVLLQIFLVGCRTGKEPALPTAPEPAETTTDESPALPAPPAEVQPPAFVFERLTMLKQSSGGLSLQVEPGLREQQLLRCWGKDENGDWIQQAESKPGRRFYEVDEPNSYAAFRLCVFDETGRELACTERLNPDRVEPMSGKITDLKTVETNGALRVSFRSEVQGEGLLKLQFRRQSRDIDLGATVTNKTGETYTLTFEPKTRKSSYGIQIKGIDLVDRSTLLKNTSVYFDGCQQLSLPEVVKIDDGCESFTVFFRPGTFDCPGDVVNSAFEFIEADGTTFGKQELMDIPSTTTNVTVNKRGFRVGEIRFRIKAYRGGRACKASETHTVAWDQRQLSSPKFEFKVGAGKGAITVSNLPENCELVAEIDGTIVKRAASPMLEFSYEADSAKSLYLFYDDGCNQSPKSQLALSAFR